MRGRELFKKYKSIITSLCVMYSLLPNRCLKRRYERIRYKVGLVYVLKRYVILKTLCKQIGDNVLVRDGCFLLNPEELEIGCNVSIQPQCYIDSFGGIVIGDDVSIAQGVSIISHTHNFSSVEEKIKNQGSSKLPIRIGNNVWIGAQAIILGNVKIGNNSIIGAGAVVKHDVEPNTIVAGVPARLIKRR